MIARVQKCQAQLERNKLDGFLITDPINRRYMSGFTGTAGIVVITLSKAFFITDFRYREQAHQQVQDMDIIIHTGVLVEELNKLLRDEGIKHLGFEEDHLTVKNYEQFKEQLESVTLVPVSSLIEQQRLIKDDDEIKLIKKAVQIADDTYTHMVSYIQAGMKEIEVALELEFYMRKLGASACSFDSIVASGYRSSFPHGIASQKIIEQGDMITLDFGAVYEGYCSDMTRTIAVGDPGEQLRHIYAICLQAQSLGVEQIRSGMTGKQADAISRQYIEKAGFGSDFGHSTGHGLGMEVHERPALSVRSEVILKPGMVVTVEPGIYLAGIGGVRIEDDILITDQGNEILTRSSKHFQMI